MEQIQHERLSRSVLQSEERRRIETGIKERRRDRQLREQRLLLDAWFAAKPFDNERAGSIPMLALDSAKPGNLNSYGQCCRPGGDQLLPT